MPEDPETAYYNVSGRCAAEAPPVRRAVEPYDRPAEGYGSSVDPYAQPRRPDPYAEYRDNEYSDPNQRDTGFPAAATRQARDRARVQERGWPGWAAVLLLVAIAGIAGLIDSISGTTVRGVFNWGLVLASLIAIIVVRRSQMFAVVIAPPLVYLVASVGLLYVRTGGLSSRSKIIDVGTNWIVYGFPAIAGATAVVLIVAGIRLVARK